MGAEPSIRELLAEVKTAQRSLEKRHLRVDEIDEIKDSVGEVRDSVNDLYKRIGRPGAEYSADDRDLERKDAITMCRERYRWQHPKNEGR